MAEVEIHTEHEHSNDEFGRRVGVIVGVIGIVLAVVTISSHRAHTAAVIAREAGAVVVENGDPRDFGSAATIAGPLPLTMLTTAVRSPWLGIGTATASLLGLAAFTVLMTAIAARRAVL